MLLSIFAVGCLVASAFAIPTPPSDYVVHEQRAIIPFGWRRIERLNGSFILPLRIGLVQTNLDKVDEYLLSVSDPTSENYGKHWSAEKIANAFKPSNETVNVVLTWLVRAGISLPRIKTSQSLGWLELNVTVNEAQNLLKTEYFKFKHTSGAPHIGCTAYHIPENVRKHIDLITPTVHFDIKTIQPKQEHARKSQAKNVTSATGAPVKPVVGNIGASDSPKYATASPAKKDPSATRAPVNPVGGKIGASDPPEYSTTLPAKKDPSATGAPVNSVVGKIGASDPPEYATTPPAKNDPSATGAPVKPVVGKTGSSDPLKYATTSLAKNDPSATGAPVNPVVGKIGSSDPPEYATTSPANNDTSAVGAPVDPDVGKKIGAPDSPSLPKQGTQINKTVNSIDGLKTCDTFITPDCLRALYEIPVSTRANPANSLGIVEYTPQIYIQEDLDLFFSNYSKDQKQRTPILNSINGGIAGNRTQGFFLNAESNLDLEYTMTLVNPQPVQLFQVGDFIEGGSFNDFLDAIDASYCTFDGGDDPVQDGRYPSTRGGYEGPKNCGGFAATKVISSSYAYNEADLTARYESRQCTEYAKLGLAGSTFLYASGDYGVSGNLFKCIEPLNKTLNAGTNGIFNPSFPASCPYVTAVGATQLKANRTVQLNSTFTSPEVAAETRIESGGGFSNVFGLPTYQAAAVKNWFATAKPPYGAERFNNSQQTRGYPDIAANGIGYIAATDDKFGLVYGTSASTPTVASIFVLINQARLDAGKSPIGFINPVLYANPKALNDVVSGTNPGCGTQGFSAQVGWDPITGLGTPNYPKLLATFLALP